MSVLGQLRESGFDEGDLERLHLLIGDWQLIADLSFADLVLWVDRRQAAGRPEDGDGPDFVAVAHCRPTTGSTVFPVDAVGEKPPPRHRELLVRALTAGVTVIADDDGSQFAKADVVPVRHDGRVIAVLTRHTEESKRSGVSRFERNYRACAASLLDMVGEGSFPPPELPSSAKRGEPRVGDGLLLLNREGRIRYASPNGVSVLYRLGSEGDIEGRYLADLVDELVAQRGTVDESLPLVLTGRAPWRSEIESGRASISLRSIPLMREGNRTGAVILARDVSEIRRRERELLSRDAMIREMHHRVKNNLQTVSALLRLQARRVSSADARSAIEEAMRRVSVIAVVHDALSQSMDESVEFDDLVDRGLRLTPDLSSPLVDLELTRSASFGPIGAEDASPLLLAVTELVTNAVEHGFPVDGENPQPVSGSVEVRPERHGNHLRLRILDDGAGLPTGTGRTPQTPPGNGLGTQIVRTLITSDLRGSIEWHERDGGGTEVVIEVDLTPVEPRA
ncbi:PAS domain-containing sensor histidine kinase [Brevibacterium sp.]|uniref:sensor histidine kinase n=1 Tax=Brevibacterium sp. TaxID=1701 RepID=UPI0025BCCDC0|nr:PAS domain-containing sensor histidine kinase [Brevibacterium sp.]